MDLWFSPVNLKGGDCSWAIPLPCLLVMSAPRVLPRLLSPCVAFNGFFFLPICGRRADSPSVRVTSSRHPRISSANLFMDEARGGTVRIVYRRRNAMYSYAARTGKRRTYSWADLGPRCCLLVYSCIWLDVLLDAYWVSLSTALSWHAMQMYAWMQTYLYLHYAVQSGMVYCVIIKFVGTNLLVVSSSSEQPFL